MIQLLCAFTKHELDTEMKLIASRRGLRQGRRSHLQQATQNFNYGGQSGQQSGQSIQQEFQYTGSIDFSDDLKLYKKQIQYLVNKVNKEFDGDNRRISEVIVIENETFSPDLLTCNDAVWKNGMLSRTLGSGQGQ